MMKLLVLYEEMAPYFFINIDKFSHQFQIPVLIVSKSPNAIAPFDLQIKSPYLKMIYREKYSFEELLNISQKFQPSCIMQSGWMYQPYFKLVKTLNTHNNIFLFDNQWVGNIKQHIGSIYFKLKYKSLFQKAFVPGTAQKIFALHLGFKESNIHTGFYCADTEYFEPIYQERIKTKKRNYNFLYIGRYAPEKNIQMLWESFIELHNKYPNQWYLICAGKGPILPIKHSKIQHVGFIQPQNLNSVVLNADVFVLPSIFEPYGVVLHEMATTGLPIIASKNAGATEYFLENNKNGFAFSPQNKNELKACLKKMMDLSDEEYFNMVKHSHLLSQKITSRQWIQKIYDICKNNTNQ